MADINLSDIIPISKANMDVLKAGGSLTKGGETYTKDNNALYIPDKADADLIDDSNSANKFVTNFVDNGTYVTLTIDGVTFNLQKYNP